MIEFLFQPIFLKVIISLILGSFLMLYYFLYCEFSKSKHIQNKRITDLEKIIDKEIIRSKQILEINLTLNQINEKASEKLDLVKLRKKS
ncbi:hypothetical protein [Algoriphagus hitonicola]|uniref:Uncharacterized protein n=1 Tax=Algoriphagus hitonicola TaxID=435880 RepID=A0A1I2UCX5_9BACT|nr:hypothetical protein [Algoriphagus hitonicola]SFG72541.1 hypothetical protein SAMN04487988_10765 [Algoriphagus hitonicola]